MTGYRVYVVYVSDTNRDEDRDDTFHLDAETADDAEHCALVRALHEWNPRREYGVVTGAFRAAVL